MKNRKWAIGFAAVMLVVLTVTGYLAIGAEYGSQQDPLVTLSYINDVLAPNTMAAIDQIFAQKSDEITAQIDSKLKEYSTQVDAIAAQIKLTDVDEAMIEAAANLVLERINQSGGLQAPAGEAQWKVVKLTKGQTLSGQVGCEILLRFGSATCVASGSPGLINLSAGADLAGGGALAANNLYLVTIDGRGLKAGNDVTLVVKGTYTVS